MVNVTEYLKSKNLYNSKIVNKFLSLQRVKYIIGKDLDKVNSKPGRYGKTFFSDDIFEIFLLWLKKSPIPLLNRKEYEVSFFICEYFKDAIKQYKFNNFIFDWYIPSHDLFIEFNENYHLKSYAVEKDLVKLNSVQNRNIFVIHELTVMIDLAKMCAKYKTT